jgi:SAM-dependent methyltransferase
MKRTPKSKKPNKPMNYGDYFIKDGKHIGDYEGVYRNFTDPWNHKSNNHQFLTDRLIALNWMKRLRADFGSTRVVEFGCGLGHLTKPIKDESFSVVGVDIAQTAIERARTYNPDCLFIKGSVSDQSIYQTFQPDIIYFAHVTWSILEEIEEVIAILKKYSISRSSKPVFLIHLLSTYLPGVQKYGADKFTNNKEILNYFSFKYLESGEIFLPPNPKSNSEGNFLNYFVARI